MIRNGIFSFLVILIMGTVHGLVPYDFDIKKSFISNLKYAVIMTILIEILTYVGYIPG